MKPRSSQPKSRQKHRPARKIDRLEFIGLLSVAGSGAALGWAIVQCAPIIASHLHLPEVVTIWVGLLIFLGVLLGVGFTLLRYRFTSRQLIVLAVAGIVLVGAALFFVSRSIGLSREHSYYEDARRRLSVPESSEEDYERAVALFKEMLEGNPGNVRARAWLSISQSLLYRFFRRGDEQLKDQARENAAEAIRLDSNSPDAHLAEARYAALKDDNNKVDAELQAALKDKPSDPMIWPFAAVTQQWRGQNDKATANYVEAIKLARNDARICFNYGHHLYETGEVNESRKLLDKAISLKPHSAYFAVVRAVAEISWTGNVQAARAILDKLPEGVDPDGRVTSARCTLALYERKFDEALRRVREYKGNSIFTVDAGGLGSQDTRNEAEGTILLFKGDPEAQKYLEPERRKYEEAVKLYPKSPEFNAALALFDAWTGRKDEAIKHADEAIKNLPDQGPTTKGVILGIAKAYAWAGERERAWQQINRFWSEFGGKTGMSIHNFRVERAWDPLRDYPEFRDFVGDVHPK
jgi:Tfp pilus assembly protein PilF